MHSSLAKSRNHQVADLPTFDIPSSLSQALSPTPCPFHLLCPSPHPVNHLLQAQGRTVTRQNCSQSIITTLSSLPRSILLWFKSRWCFPDECITAIADEIWLAHFAVFTGRGLFEALDASADFLLQRSTSKKRIQCCAYDAVFGSCVMASGAGWSSANQRGRSMQDVRTAGHRVDDLSFVIERISLESILYPALQE